MRINTNTAAANTYSRLNSANASKANSLAKLSSGLRINKAGTMQLDCLFQKK